MNKTAQTFIETANIYAALAAEWNMCASDGHADGSQEAVTFWLMAFQRVEFARLVNEAEATS